MLNAKGSMYLLLLRADGVDVLRDVYVHAFLG